MNKTRILTHPSKNVTPCCNKHRSGALYLTQKIEYGLTLLSTLAKSESSQSIKKIADKKNISFPFLQKTARALQKAKIIKASRGKYGGYVLNKNPKSITLKEIIEAIEGPIALVPCLKKSCKSTCQKQKNCDTFSPLQEINEELLIFFASKTLDNFIKNG